ncbi:hypothetical protein LCGC14_2222780, partial [marine sediment metagenome]
PNRSASFIPLGFSLMAYTSEKLLFVCSSDEGFEPTLSAQLIKSRATKSIIKLFEILIRNSIYYCCLPCFIYRLLQRLIPFVTTNQGNQKSLYLKSSNSFASDSTNFADPISQCRILLGNRFAITPRRMASVRFAAYENGALHLSFPKQASTN